MTDRDDAALKHFKSRSQQPNNHTIRGVGTPPSRVVIAVYDNNFGNTLDGLERTRFLHTGVSPQLTMYERACAHRNSYCAAADGIEGWGHGCW